MCLIFLLRLAGQPGHAQLMVMAKTQYIKPNSSSHHVYGHPIDHSK
jgi:hypothetical protein